MPLLLRCEEIEPGMRLYEAAIWRRRLLLTADKILTRADVDSLQRNYPELSVRVRDPFLDDVADFEDDSHDRTIALTARSKIASVMSSMSAQLTAQSRISVGHVRTLQSTVTGVMHYLSANPATFALLPRGLDSKNYLIEHAGNVFFLSMTLGSAVRDYVDQERRRMSLCQELSTKITLDLSPLGLGAMLSDMAMFQLHDLIVNDGPLSEEDRKAIREHPQVGADMLPPGITASARNIVRTHHENFDGTGYPAALQRDRIHVFSRIVRIADSFAAATATHVYKEAKPPARVLWEMTTGPLRRLYDPVLMRVFRSLIQPFPIGVRLRLRDGRFAVVVRYNRQDPFFPTVIIAFDDTGKRLPEHLIDGPFNLAKRSDVLVQSIDDEDISFIYQGTKPPERTPDPDAIGSLFCALYP